MAKRIDAMTNAPLQGYAGWQDAGTTDLTTAKRRHRQWAQDNELTPLEVFLTEPIEPREEWETPFARDWIATLRKRDAEETKGMTDEQIYRAANQFSRKLPLKKSVGPAAAKKIRAAAYANVRKAGQGP